MECILLSNKAKSVETVDYCDINCKSEKILTTNILKKDISKKKYNIICSYSSIEHSGLGRYGDPINPNGDVEQMEQIYNLLEDDGVAVIGIPVGSKNVIQYNAHRIYDKNYVTDVLFKRFDIIKSIPYPPYGDMVSYRNTDWKNQPFFVLQKKKEKKYGYSFTLRNSGGLCAIIHDVMMAHTYANCNGLTLYFTKEGYDVPRLNGSIEDIELEDKNWHSYFSSFPICEEKECIEQWPNFIPGTNDSIPYESQYNPTYWYSDLIINDICLFNKDVYDEIYNLVKKTPFNSDTDIVVHVRRTDKCFDLSEELYSKFLKNNMESEIVPLRVYADKCFTVLMKNKLKRIYICTDDIKICNYFVDYFEDYDVEVVWDKTESEKPLQAMRIAEKLPKREAQNETMVAFKNLFIMKDAKVLIGGRMSYFFRIAELLRYPLETIDLKESKKFKIAPYSKNQIHFTNFISPELNIDEYSSEFKKNKIAVIPNFVSKDLLNDIRNDIENYKWFMYYFIPVDNIWKPRSYNLKTPVLSDRYEECNKNRKKNNFTYRFKRQIGKHYDTCVCVTCKLYATLAHPTVINKLEQITGLENLRPGEFFLSKYSKGDFLSTHHDKKKVD